MRAIVGKGCTMRDLKRLSSAQQLYNFIQQLNVFPPIDIKLIVESVKYESSTSIDHNVLQQNLKNAFLSPEEAALSLTFSNFMSSSQMELTTSLKSKINWEEFARLVGSRKGRITKDLFQKILIKMGIFMSKGGMRRYFEALGDGLHIELEDLLKNNTEVTF